ncbi:MAG TPA: ATP-binding protein [Actinomycetota bacterium]|nr:ATP-binding protein [Actinomycetota bacterium]
MAGPTSAQVTRIHIPAAAEHIATVRAFIGAVARHSGCTEETVEDLRLAATETCAQALAEGTAPDGIDVRASLEAGDLVIEIEPAARFVSPLAPADPLDPSSGERRRALVSALFPDVRILAPDDGSPSLRVAAPVEDAPDAR